MVKYCSNCGSYLYSAQHCASCGTPVPGALPQLALPPGLIEVTRALGEVSTVAAVNVFTNLWELATPEQKAEVVAAYVARALERVKEGKADEHIQKLVVTMVESVDSPTYFAEESRAVLSKAFAERLNVQLTDPGSRAYGSIGQAIMQDSVLISSIASASKKVAEEYMPQIESLIRDRMAANLDKIVDEAVEKVAADALANVIVKKANT